MATAGAGYPAKLQRALKGVGLPHPPRGCSHSCPHRCPARGDKPRKAHSGAREAGPSSRLCPTGLQPAQRPHFLPHIPPHEPTPCPAGSDSTSGRRASPGLCILFLSSRRTKSLCTGAGAELPGPISCSHALWCHSRNAQAGPSPPASVSAPCLPSAPRPAGSREGKQKRSEPERGEAGV